MRFSQVYGIRRKASDDWFDTIVDADTELFVDPFLIFLEQRARGPTRMTI